MNILLLTPIYPEPQNFGLIPDTKAIHYFVQEWIKLGHNVLVVHPYWNPISRVKRFFTKTHAPIVYEIDNVKVLFGESQIFVPHKLESFKHQQIALSEDLYSELQNLNKDFKPDCIVVHFPTIGVYFNENFISKFHKCKKVCTVHGVDIRNIKSNPSSKKSLLFYDKRLYRSYTLGKEAHQLGINDNNNIVLSGIDCNLIKSEEKVNKKLNRENKSVKFVYAGKLVKQKRVDVILKALSMLPKNLEYSFRVIGDGPEKENLISLSKSLGIANSVEFLGYLNRSEVSNLMDESDIFVMVSNGETLGLVYLEAMACGCIPVGSRGEGIDGIIEDTKNGYLCEPGNEIMLVNTLKTIFSLNKLERNKIAMDAYNTVKSMTSTNMAKQYLNLL